jgi:hypothetical protein
MPWTPTAIDDEFRSYWHRRFDGVAPPQRFETASTVAPGNLVALVGREPVGLDADPRWHLALAADGDRDPTLEEFICATSSLRPNVPFAVAIPPSSWFLQVRPRVFHAWEYRDAAIRVQWQGDSR